MINTLITSETRIKLLLKFFLNPGNRGYLRQLAKEFNESTNGIRVELNRLTEANILVASHEGRNKIYRANIHHPLFEEIRRIVLKSTGIDQVVSNILQKLGPVKVAFIRGDYATGRDSGLIDLVIVSNEINVIELNRITTKTERLIGRKIALVILSTNDYEKLKTTFNKDEVLLLVEDTL